MNKNISEYIERLLQKTAKSDCRLLDSKSIQYGERLVFTENKQECSVSIYFSKKKGISTVVSSNKNNRELIYKKKHLINPIRAELSLEEFEFNNWIGTDESGKGDYFGPLVVAGFACHDQDLHKLIKLGVNDSKKISDKQVLEITHKLYKNFKERIKVILLTPQKYNELYDKFRKQNKKLNQVLAWMHSRVILDLNKKTKINNAIIDKFANDSVIKKSLKDMKHIKIVNKPRAESNPAVAAASIIARYHFLKNIEQLSRKLNLEIPLGAGKTIITTGKKIQQKFGEEELNNVAKTHFKTTKEILR